jgi:hypothetical protein
MVVTSYDLVDWLAYVFVGTRPKKKPSK